MALSAGTQVGCYEILALIGAGGMGEVYRAKDTRLKREVALKVLPDSFANDPERMARFQREAEVLASLNHSNIAAIYGIEDRALVMELVDGETLKGPLPIETALNYGKQIAAALEAAHEKGIIHRDLKPANIKVTPQEVVKVLDFGLAAVTQPSADQSRDPSVSPTMTISPTRVGMILGTAAYMSPEQACGKLVDKRADIWAFGCVLYELLTGRPAFTGETITDVLAAVVKTEPDWNAVPEKVRWLLVSCLQKDPKQRLRDIGDAWLQVDKAPNKIHEQKRIWLPWAVLSLLLSSIAAWALLHSPPAEPRLVTRWTMPLAATDPGLGFGLSLSRNGTHLAYSDRTAGGSQIVLRSLDQTDAKPIAGSKDGLRPFFSPDGRWLAYFTGLGGAIKKIAITGGTSITLCEDASYFGGSWGEDNQIVFSAKGGTALMQVPASGGKCEILTTPDRQKGEIGHRWPQILPGGRSLLFTIGTSRLFADARIAVLDRATRTYRVLVEGASVGRYVPSGHLVYVRGGALFAAPFDLKRLVITGPEAPVIEGVYFNSTGGFADYSFSGSGLLVYMQETRLTSFSTLDWVDRKGNSNQSALPAATYTQAVLSANGSSVRLSPDGRRAAVTITGGAGDRNIWIGDLLRGTLSRLTSGGTSDHPAWTPDGRHVVFYQSSPTEVRGIYWTPADGSGKPELLVKTPLLYAFPDSWAPDGRTLLYQTTEPGRIWTFTLPGTGHDSETRALFEATQFNEGEAELSPDGHWMIYVSDESGKNQVYARPFPGPGSKVPISIDAGETPRWSGSGREVFYFDPAKNRVMAVDIEAGSSELHAGQPHSLFDQQNRDWDVAVDGKRFLARRLPQTEQNQAKLQVVVNWFEELRRRAPVSGK